MARTSDLEGGKANTRKRQLNLIYFVDSARTKSLSIPMFQLKLLLAFLFLLVTWSIGSTVAVTWLVLEKTDLATRLKASLATVFDYERRYDRVYDTAYPPDHGKAQEFSQHSSPAQPSDPLDVERRASGHGINAGASLTANSDRPEPARSNPTTAPAGFQTRRSNAPIKAAEMEQGPESIVKPASAAPLPRKHASAPTSAQSFSPSNADSAAPQTSSQPTLGTGPGSATTAVPGTAGVAGQAPPPSASNSQSAPNTGKTLRKNLESTIAVTNPVLEPKKGQLDLRFDLTNRTSKARAEGYIWAIAEFKGDDGRTLYQGAPGRIDVNEKGEPRNPKLSAPFGIRHFKRKSFTFPYFKDRSGTFTAIRIVVTDKTGNDRTTYNVPVEIRIPKGS